MNTLTGNRLLKNNAFRYRIHLAIIVSTVFMLISFCQAAGLFRAMENRTIDMRMKWVREKKYMPDQIVLILIDEASLAAMKPLAGRWPWRRELHADMIDFLAFSGAKKIIFDIWFSESSTTFDKQDDYGDKRLVDATENSGNVIHACQLVQDPADELNPQIKNIGTTYWENDQFNLSIDLETDMRRYTTAYFPFVGLDQASRQVGVISFSPDVDAIYRRTELVFRIGDRFLPALSIAPFVESNRRLRLEKRLLSVPLSIKTLEIPLDENNDYHVNLYGKYNAFSFSGVYLSYLCLRQGLVNDLPVKPDEFKDKIVFIGASAAGVEDLKTTGLGRQVPGVLLHASIYGNLISEDWLHYLPQWGNYLILFFTILISAAGIFCSSRLRVQVTVCAAIIVLLSANAVLLFRINWVIQLVPSVFASLSIYVAGFTILNFSTAKEKRKIKTILGQYVSPSTLSHVLTDPKTVYLSAEVGQREYLSVLFSDIRGFTRFSEQFPVEQVVAVLNRYLEIMVDIIFDREGTLDKFIGDAIMAFWGAPVKTHDHACKAVLAALDMQQAMTGFNQQIRKNGLPEMQIGIGVHSAEVILGNIGSQKKMDYTVIGDGVNLASRLEELTKFYGCPILFSDETCQILNNRVAFRSVDKVCVKGKGRPTMLYQAVAARQSLTRFQTDIIDSTAKGFEHYRQRRFAEALACYQHVLRIDPKDRLSRLFIGRCNQYRHNPPPPDWQGTYVFDHK